MEKLRFAILIIIVTISGFSQGMLLPVLAIIFEQQGYPASLNGLHATGLYIGVLLASPFMEQPLRKFGYKKLIITGGCLVFLSLFCFTFIQSFWLWFALRILIGIGDHMLHFSTQTWITSISSKENRGRNISLYGFCFGLGFAAGPFLAGLAEIKPALPFIITGSISFVIWLLAFLLRNDFPEDSGYSTVLETAKRFTGAWKIGWIAFLPPFCYGFLEAAINGSYPVYAIKTGMTAGQIGWLLPAFAVGSIIFQLPLGMLSDKYGRRNIILFVMFFGFADFALASLTSSFSLLLVFFLIAGMLVGTTFSLGLSYMADLLPKNLLPAGNLLCGICFSAGSIIGPTLGGMYVQLFKGGNPFHIISIMLLSIFFINLFYKKPMHQKEEISI
ncbi:MFS transporter [Metabacillus sp. GX 13764]|uniref:MFS transporter n=1 Tax=Metabacillus kandeliae TaxID=2900151 RepID=UPI001E60C913|nr:MFS transporter [Metabacillus kandeliae]MCD7036326.1 MFS transporter [Metabacillus kandeliae]